MALIGEETEETVAVCSCTEHCQPGAVNMNCEICAKDMTQCVGKEAVQEPEPAEDPVETEPEESEETGSGLNPAVLVLVLALVGVGGAFAYFKLVKHTLIHGFLRVNSCCLVFVLLLIAPILPLFYVLFLRLLLIFSHSCYILAYGGGQRPLVRSRTAAVRSE